MLSSLLWVRPIQVDHVSWDLTNQTALLCALCVFRWVLAFQFVVGSPPPPLWLKLLIGILLHRVGSAIMGDQDATRSNPGGDGGNLWKACKSDPSSLQPPNADVVTERNPSLHTPLHCCAIMDRLDAACVRHVLEFCFTSPSALHHGIACCSRRLNICWRNYHRRFVLKFAADIIAALQRSEPVCSLALVDLEDIL